MVAATAKIFIRDLISGGKRGRKEGGLKSGVYDCKPSSLLKDSGLFIRDSEHEHGKIC